MWRWSARAYPNQLGDRLSARNSSCRQSCSSCHVGRGDPIEGVGRAPATGDGDFVSVGQVFDLDPDPFGLAERPHVCLSVGYADVPSAVAFGDAQLGGFVWGHEVEDAGAADGPNDGGGAASVLYGGFGLSRLRLAGVMQYLAGGVGLAGNGAEPLLHNQVHVHVAALVHRVERHPRVKDEHVGLVALDYGHQGIESGLVKGWRATFDNSKPQGPVAHRLDHQTTAEVGLSHPVTFADSSDPAVEFVLILLGVQVDKAQRFMRPRLAGCEIAGGHHLDGLEKAIGSLGPTAGADGGANVLTDEVSTVEKFARWDGRRV